MAIKKRIMERTDGRHDGTITLNHALGRDPAPLVTKERPELFCTVIRGAKATLDPQQILNPGVLFDRPETHSGPLKGFRVLDLQPHPRGPWSLSAHGGLRRGLIKVERRSRRDDTRVGPPSWKPRRGSRDPPTSSRPTVKRSQLTLDISTEDGQKIIRELAATGRRSGTTRQAIGATGSITSLQRDRHHPDSARPEPCSQRPGWLRHPGHGWLIGVTGEAERNAGRPMKCGVPVSDLMTAMYAISGIPGRADRATDQRSRAVHRHGTSLDAWLANQASNYLVSSEKPGAHGRAIPIWRRTRPSRASDGDVIVLSAATDSSLALCQVLECERHGKPDALRQQQRAARHITGGSSRPSNLTAARSKVVALTLTAAGGVPVGPVLSIKEALDDPQSGRGLVSGR